MEAKVIATGLGRTEGPVVSVKGGIVVTSMDQGAVFRIHGDGTVERTVPGGDVNGAAEDRSGRIFLAQEGGSPPATRVAGITGGVQVVESNGRVEWVTQDPISPNDLCFGPDGYLYVTDPTRRRNARDPEKRGDGRLWRVDPATGDALLLASLGWYPNGIGFGPDDRLYVASTGEGKVVRFDVADGRLSEREEYVSVGSGGPDGFAFDAEGNLAVCCIGFDGAPGHLEIWSPDHELLKTITPGPNPLYTNVAIDQEGRLIVTDTQVDGGVIVYEHWRRAGLLLYPFRNGPK